MDLSNVMTAILARLQELMETDAMNSATLSKITLVQRILLETDQFAS